MNCETIKKSLAQKLDKERYQHSLQVEALALELAAIYKVDEKKAQSAALLHDVSRYMNRKQMLAFAKKIKLSISKTEREEPKILHAQLSQYIAQTEFGINDQEILDAIKYHTLGRPKMSDLEKIIYLADHVEPGRKYPGVEKIRELAKQNLDQAIVLSTKRTTEYLKEKNATIDPRTHETNQYYTEVTKS